MRRSLLAIAVGLSLAAWAGTARGDELVLYPGSQCRVMKKPKPFLERVGPGAPAERPAPELDRVVTFDVSHFVLERQSAESCAVCTRDLAYERADHRTTVDAALALAAPEPGWRIAVRWAAIGVAMSAAFAAGAVLF